VPNTARSKVPSCSAGISRQRRRCTAPG
jgi:hypothetical protein